MGAIMQRLEVVRGPSEFPSHPVLASRPTPFPTQPNPTQPSPTHTHHLTHPPTHHPRYNWDEGNFMGQIPEAEETYNVIGNMNE